MTIIQGKKVTELHTQGWTSVENPNDPDNLICGGPTFIRHPDGSIFTVESNGDVNKYETNA